MKKLLLITAILVSVQYTSAQATTEFKVITVIESIVPGGLGRSRLIENGQELNIDEFTTERTNGKKSSQGDIKRKDAKIDKFSESKLLNFYSVTGINFQNVASNDALITSKLNQMAADGWELTFVTSGVESDAGTSDGMLGKGGGQNDGKGIFITRFIFKRSI